MAPSVGMSRADRGDIASSGKRRIRGVLGAALAAVLAAGAALVATPFAYAAPADGTVADATLDWGVKQSFRSYLFGPIAHGAYELLGNTTASAENLRPAAEHLSWSGGTGTAATDGSTADVSFGAGNGVHFTGHEMTVDGVTAPALDMQFTNPRVEVTSATEGTLYLDVKSRKFEGMTSISQEFFEESNVPFATLNLADPEADGATFTWSAAPATLTDQGGAAFGGFYEPGEVLDPVTFTLPIKAVDDGAVEPGDGSADPGDGVADGDGSADPDDGSTDPGDGSSDPGDASSDPDGEADGAVGTTTTVTAAKAKITEGDELRIRAAVTPREAVGSVQFAFGQEKLGNPVEVAGGAAGLTTSALPEGTHQITATFVPKDPEAFAESTSDPDEVVVGKKQEGPVETIVEAATLDWGVKASFRSYLQGPIAHGTIDLLGATTSDDENMRPKDREFHWTGGAGEAMSDGSSADVTFGAEDGVAFTGHEMTVDGTTAPALDMRFTKPRVKFTASGEGTLYLDVKSREFTSMTEISDKFFEAENVAFAKLDLSAPQVLGTTYTWSEAEATLTEQGAEAFGGFYDAGVELDPVTFTADLGESTGPVPTPKSTKTTLSASRDSIVEGNEVTLTAAVAPAAVQGTVQFTHGTQSLGTSDVKNGKASVKTRALPVGEQTITATFTPTDSRAYQRSTGTTLISVGQKGSGTIGTMSWGVKESFQKYVTGPIAHGSVSARAGASQKSKGDPFVFRQVEKSNWNSSTGRGTVEYAGAVQFTGHEMEGGHALNLTFLNPRITVTSATTAQLIFDVKGLKFEGMDQVGGALDMKNVVMAKVKLGSPQQSGGTATWSNASATLTKQGAEAFGGFYEAGVALDPVTFTVGENDPNLEKAGAETPQTPKASKQGPAARAAGAAGGGGSAGSLTWGVSKYFADYTSKKSGSGCPTPSKHCAGGSIETTGVGSGWLFPQAEGSSWDKSSQTGTVKFSGIVSFKGYGMTMFQVANPSITVNSASSATLHTGNTTSYGKSSYSLDLSSASKAVGPNGEVTWSNVPVRGSLMGISASQTIGFDDLTFTVGDPSRVSYGATQDGGDKKQYTAAATPPTTEGLEILTPEDKIREGGRIEAQASGFEPEDEGVLVVLYTDPVQGEPIVLDDEATADESGVVKWSGTLPKQGTGNHVLTLQGSSDAGAKITILDAAENSSAQAVSAAAADGSNAGGGPLPDLLRAAGLAPWEWWVSAGSLVAIAACTSVLVVRQRRELAGMPAPAPA